MVHPQDIYAVPYSPCQPRLPFTHVTTPISPHVKPLLTGCSSNCSCFLGLTSVRHIPPHHSRPPTPHHTTLHYTSLHNTTQHITSHHTTSHHNAHLRPSISKYQREGERRGKKGESKGTRTEWRRRESETLVRKKRKNLSC